MDVIEAINLTKTYRQSMRKKITVVDQIHLHVKKGEIFGFLGPNGAGKTTTIKMLLGILYPTSGEAKIFGKNVEDVQTHHLLSYLPEKPYYYEHMTGLGLLTFYASLFGISDSEKCKKLLERVHLQFDSRKPIGQYSKGMQQRLGFAQCLINDPQLLFLDEPTAGLDPVAHSEIRDLILQFRDEGKTVFLSSHELSEVERICDRVAIINKGKIQKQGKLNELLHEHSFELTAENTTLETAQYFKENTLFFVSYHKNSLILNLPAQNQVNPVIDLLRSKGAYIVSLIPKRKRLEDLYLETVHTDAQYKIQEANQS